jgi:hypothetical protein
MRHGKLVAEAKVIKAGSTLGYVECDVKDQAGIRAFQLPERTGDLKSLHYGLWKPLRHRNRRTNSLAFPGPSSARRAAAPLGGTWPVALPLSLPSFLDLSDPQVTISP